MKIFVKRQHSLCFNTLTHPERGALCPLQPACVQGARKGPGSSRVLDALSCYMPYFGAFWCPLSSVRCRVVRCCGFHDSSPSLPILCCSPSILQCHPCRAIDVLEPLCWGTASLSLSIDLPLWWSFFLVPSLELHVQRNATSEIQYDSWYSYKTNSEAFKHLMKC